MLREARYLLPVILVVAALALAASYGLDLATRRWFVRDVAQRGLLAVSVARQALIRQIRAGDTGAIRGVLSEISRDERILSSAVCTADMTLVATNNYPSALSCARLSAKVLDPEAPAWQPWEEIVELAGGRVHVNVIPLVGESSVAGFAVLLHDLSFVDRRESLARRLLIAVMAVLGAAMLLITFAAARFSFRRWTHEMRRILRGGLESPEFRPVLHDVRELVARLATEMADDGQSRQWTPQRLKHVLQSELGGDKVIVVANREPYIHSRSEDGALRVLHPASGLVTALEPVMRACSGVWVAHGSGDADREAVDRHDRVLVPPGERSYAIRRIWLTPEQERGYYYGFSNEGLWPLCHLAHARPTFRREDWNHYVEVNLTFAKAVCEEADSEDPVILVQDYHFALAPRFVRQRLPRATILAFWHIPWPNAESLGICPWREEILDGLLGASILGFHTQAHCNNFLEAVDRFLEARIDREQQGVVHGGRPTLVRGYPISIEWPNRWVREAPSIEECRASVRAELGLPSNAILGIGIDRVDYTKGIEERLLAVERLLERQPGLRGRFAFVQMGAPSRVAIPRYAELNGTIDREAERINARFGAVGYRPIALLRGHHEPPDVFRYYRAAEVCYVSSLHDGMNLVAKEFVASRDDEGGVLILSQFTGAARELTEALIVNPYDLEEASSALLAAVQMPPDEQRDRMRAMRVLVSEFNIYRWAGRMLRDGGRLRTRERLWGRLATWPSPSPARPAPEPAARAAAAGAMERANVAERTGNGRGDRSP
jgi:trehalose 6-phosphate synthase